MNLEHQVCSLDLAKKLKALGVKQESVFWWCRAVRKKSYRIILGKPDGYAEKVAAFTVAELGLILPKECITVKHEPNFWVASYLETKHRIAENTEADARALMLIYLIEHGIVKP